LLAKQQMSLQVDGMTCGGCTSSVEKALTAQSGVKSATASIEEANVQIEFDPSKIQEAALRNVIEDAGFNVGS
jgi:copper chaperone